MHSSRLARAGALVLTAFLMSGCAYLAQADVPVSGSPDPAASARIWLSGDGRYVAFESYKSNLVPASENLNPTDGEIGVYLRDNRTKTTKMLGGFAFLGSDPGISADGRFVVFLDDEGWVVYDRTTGSRRPIAYNADGTGRTSVATSVTISANGRYVAFREHTTEISTYVTDLRAHTTKLLTTISHPPGSETGWLQFSDALSLSRDGSVLSQATCANATANRLGAFCTSWTFQIWDVVHGTVEAPLPDAPDPYSARLSGNAGLVAYSSGTDVKVLDRSNGASELVDVSVDAAPASGQYPQISTDGRYVTFESSATNLVAGYQTSGASHIYLRDRVRKTTIVVDAKGEPPGGDSGGGTARYASINADGRYVAFMSTGSSLTADTPGMVKRVFTRFMAIPEITGVAPATAARGGTRHLTVNGLRFRPDVVVNVSSAGTKDLAITNLVVTESKLTFDVAIPASTPAQPFNVNVYNPGTGPGSEAGAGKVCAQCFTVTG